MTVDIHSWNENQFAEDTKQTHRLTYNIHTHIFQQESRVVLRKLHDVLLSVMFPDSYYKFKSSRAPKGVPVDLPQSRSAPGRSAPRLSQVQSFHPRCWVVPPKLFGRFATKLYRPTPGPYSRGGGWGLRHKNWQFLVIYGSCSISILVFQIHKY